MLGAPRPCQWRAVAPRARATLRLLVGHAPQLLGRRADPFPPTRHGTLRLPLLRVREPLAWPARLRLPTTGAAPRRPGRRDRELLVAPVLPRRSSALAAHAAPSPRARWIRADHAAP